MFHTKIPSVRSKQVIREVSGNNRNQSNCNGFHLPKAKSISHPSDNSKPFKSAKKSSKFLHLRQMTKKKPVIHSPYIQALHKHKIYLDNNQIEAVVHPNGALLVLAGAGSGKTRVLTARTAFLLSEQNVEPNQIMLVTFTAKAATEMKSRLINYPYMNRSQINRLVTGTFHSLVLSNSHPSLSTKMESS